MLNVGKSCSLTVVIFACAYREHGDLRTPRPYVKTARRSLGYGILRAWQCWKLT
jgi:hypothetical protein